MTDTRIDLDDARRAILADTEPVGGHEIVATDEAVGRVLGRAVEAPLSLPPFPASAMDGYALRSRDVAGEPPYRLHVAGVSYAGHPLEGVVPPGTCVRIFTGAAMPEGLDAVVIQEDCVRRGDEVVVSEPVAAGQNVRPIAHDVAAGSCLFDAGHRLGEFDTAWLAACGISAVTVHRRPLVAIFSTGDELTEPGDHLGPGRIFDANRHALRTLLAHLPVDVEDLGIVDDSREAIRKTLEYADTSCDVVVTSGGVSVGDADWVRGVVDEIGHLRLW
ncbi:MAG: molybdopterin molybdotransferase MoeA [Pseudomonadota bacterium]